jgi:hypothetical protein
MSSPVPAITEETFELLGVQLCCATTDAAFLDEFSSVFGGRSASAPAEPPAAVLHAEVDPRSDEPGFGRVDVRGDDLADPLSFLLGFASATVPFRRLGPESGGDLGLGDDPEPVFRFREGGQCLFRLVPRWRRILAHFLFLRLLRLRPDLVFFHGASLEIAGRGVLLLGPKGTGKTTTSLALAALGHGFLGDETAAYHAASGCLLPFRRPVAIKPGPRAAAVEAALLGWTARDEDGLVRAHVDRLLPAPLPSPVPLSAVLFLSGFEPAPRLERIQPGRDEVAAMQPLASSMQGADAGRRMFEMMRLLGRAACYRLAPGPPDETAARLTEVLRA